MRLTIAIDRYLSQMQIERDFTERSLHSYAWTLARLDNRYPDAVLSDLEGRDGTEMIRAVLAPWARLATSTRGTRISHLKSFFDWLEQEGLMEANPARRIQRPPLRKPSIERPTEAELELVRGAALCTRDEQERPAVLAMLGAGMRRAAVLASRWGDWNLTDGTVRLILKGGDAAVLPLDPDVVDDMRACHLALQPDPDDFIFPSQRVQLVGPGRNVRTVRDPKQPSSPQALWNMLHRVCKRAGVRPLHPHLLRHGFATQLDRDDVDLRTIQFLMGHQQVETTQRYLDERRLEAAKAKLHNRRQSGRHPAFDSPGVAQSQQSGWRESNPQENPAEVNTRPEHNAVAPEGDPNQTEEVSHEA